MEAFRIGASGNISRWRRQRSVYQHMVFVLIMLIAAFLGTDPATLEMRGDCLEVSVQTAPQVPSDMRFEPPWRTRGDCGPLSLYVLMRLKECDMSLQDVKKQVPFQSDLGCSLADLARGADSLGFPTEIRFVKPQDLSKVSFPFILHTAGSLEKGTGHFLVVVDYSSEKKAYEVIDTTFGTYGEVTEVALLENFSGFVLIPQDPVGTNVILLSTGCVLGFAIFALLVKRCRKAVCRTDSSANNITLRE